MVLSVIPIAVQAATNASFSHGIGGDPFLSVAKAKTFSAEDNSLAF